MTPFQDTKEGQTHYYGDGCNDPHGKDDNPPRLMFAVVTYDIAGQTISLFKTKKQASEYLEAIK